MMASGMFGSRKAEFSILLALLGTVIVGIMLLFIGYKIVIGSSAMNQEEKCRLSIFAADQASALKRTTLDAFDMVPNLECEAKDVEIRPKDVRRSKRGRIDDDLLKGKLATEYYKCWNMVGAGDLNPFQGAWPEKDKTFCLRCAEIEFSEDFAKEYGKQGVTGLLYWMATRRIPGKEKTFYEYMFKRQASTKEIQNLKSNPDYLAFDKKYTLVWRFERQDRKLTGVLLILAPVAGVAATIGGLATGGMQEMEKIGKVWISTGVYLLPYEQLSETIQFVGSNEKKDTCTILVN
jgi:hypothetical protein